ncbi:P-loop ATPase, Sll1717 family, partial [Arcanobacterium phocae]|uniref:P-loop ATPase, Sll1717 family n=1 Tax=Arcanobacterium phocae TaxID=131112 RepID=UPI001C0E8F17
MKNKSCIVCRRNPRQHDYYCNRCYQRVRKNREYFELIQKEWKLEAKRERQSYFYFVNEAKELLSGSKCFVIGRKGEGKTALAQYIYNQSEYNQFTAKMTFKDVPFNTIYKLTDDSFTKPNQYSSIWKYLIYITVCKQMIKNNSIDSVFRKQLGEIFPDENTKLAKLIKKYTVREFGIRILNIGMNIEREEAHEETTWIEAMSLLEDIIIENIDDSKYYIVFDELDEDYKNFQSDQERTNYFDMVTGLFKAVQDVRATFDERNKNVFPIIFLRTDIYDQITYSDKNKWSDSIINIVWTPDKLKALLRHRLNVLFENEPTHLSFDVCWKQIFGTSEMSYGANGVKKMGSFEYILRSTQNRPRDFIKYFQECAKQALNNNSLV